jgi:hypothetical protein
MKRLTFHALIFLVGFLCFVSMVGAKSVLAQTSGTSLPQSKLQQLLGQYNGMYWPPDLVNEKYPLPQWVCDASKGIRILVGPKGQEEWENFILHYWASNNSINLNDDIFLNNYHTNIEDAASVRLTPQSIQDVEVHQEKYLDREGTARLCGTGTNMVAKDILITYNIERERLSIEHGQRYNAFFNSKSGGSPPNWELPPEPIDKDKALECDTPEQSAISHTTAEKLAKGCNPFSDKSCSAGSLPGGPSVSCYILPSVRFSSAGISNALHINVTDQDLNNTSYDQTLKDQLKSQYGYVNTMTMANLTPNYNGTRDGSTDNSANSTQYCTEFGCKSIRDHAMNDENLHKTAEFQECIQTFQPLHDTYLSSFDSKCIFPTTTPETTPIPTSPPAPPAPPENETGGNTASRPQMLPPKSGPINNNMCPTNNYNVDPCIINAIAAIESGGGINMGSNTCGSAKNCCNAYCACGPMQMSSAQFNASGVGGNMCSESVACEALARFTLGMKNFALNGGTGAHYTTGMENTMSVTPADIDTVIGKWYLPYATSETEKRWGPGATYAYAVKYFCQNQTLPPYSATPGN